MLRDLSLAQIDESGTMISVHRLIQGEWLHYLTLEARARSWRSAVALLRAAFPRQEKGFALFNHWRLCEALIEHVTSLAARFAELDDESTQEPSDDFVNLVSDASRQVHKCPSASYSQAPPLFFLVFFTVMEDYLCLSVSLEDFSPYTYIYESRASSMIFNAPR